jgi:hypothetical protein
MGPVTADGTAPDTAGRAPLEAGTAVEVRNRFDGSWARGFEVAEAVGDRCRIRRRSDGAVLPELFGRDEVRRERRRQGFWWY